MIRIPNTLIYLLALIAVLSVIFETSPPVDAPESEPPPLTLPADENAPLLPVPSPFDERVLVEVGQPSDSVGTAFAVGERGVWVTARHVVDGCGRVGIDIGRGGFAPVQSVDMSTFADLAVLRTGRAPAAVPVALDEPLRLGELGYHIGYPQGRPGEVVSRLIGRSTLVTRGRLAREEQILTWAENGRTRGLVGSLGGLSGGPVFDAEGRVVGVTLAESPRRGRIYTADPQLVADLLLAERLAPAPVSVGPLEPENYGQVGDELRQRWAVVKVVCQVEGRRSASKAAPDTKHSGPQGGQP